MTDNIWFPQEINVFIVMFPEKRKFVDAQINDFKAAVINVIKDHKKDMKTTTKNERLEGCLTG